MEQKHKALLRFNRVRLVEDLVDFNGVCDRLAQDDIITLAMLEELEAVPTNSGKVRNLLGCLPKRGPRAFSCFWEALRETHNAHLAELLNPPPESEPDETKDGGGNMGGLCEGLDDLDGECTAEEDCLPTHWPPLCNFDANDVHVKQCNANDPETLARILDRDNVYKMLSSPRGHALIVNNINFDSNSLNTRRGAYLDSISMDLLVNGLDFEVKHYSDLDLKASVSLFEEESKFDHSGYDCFILVYMSYGDHSYVYSLDGKRIQISDIMAYFDGENCPSLAGKPKLFFFLNGFSVKVDKGVATSKTGTDEDEQVLCYLSSRLVEDKRANSNRFRTAHSKVPQNSTPSDVTTIPTKADMFCGLASVPGYVTLRKKDFGAWFIQAIVHVFQRFAHKEELGRLMRKVNRLVSYGCALVKDKDFPLKQMPMYQSTLRKDLYFFPGMTTYKLLQRK